MLKDPREFSDMSDGATNTGYFGQDRDYDEIRPRSLTFNSDEIDEEDTPEDGFYEGGFE